MDRESLQKTRNVEALFLELREKAFEPTQAVEVLGKTAGVLRDSHEYRSLLERARVYQDALLMAANLVGVRLGLDTHELLARRNTK